MCKGNVKIKSLKEFDFRLYIIWSIIRGYFKIYVVVFGFENVRSK